MNIEFLFYFQIITKPYKALPNHKKELDSKLHCQNSKKGALMYCKQGTSPVIFFSTLPGLEDLCTIDVSVVNKTDGSSVVTPSILQPQVIRCRELIFTEPEILASPSYGDECTFHVVLKQSLYRTGRLQSRFQKIGLKASNPCCVTPVIFQSCLNYTIQARIAPKWNRAGQWLIQGRDFLTHSGYANAVKMDLTVTSGELFFTLEASTVRFPTLQLMDLDVLGAKYDQFIHDPMASIDSQSIMQTWCHVLPSMKKGQIVSVHHNLPKNGRFKCYQDIKRHWKNSYGYRLPDNEAGMIYYQIYFRPLGDRLFTYPEEKAPHSAPNLSNKNPTAGRVIYRNSADLLQRLSTPSSTTYNSASTAGTVNRTSHDALSSSSREAQRPVPHTNSMPELGKKQNSDSIQTRDHSSANNQNKDISKQTPRHVDPLSRSMNSDVATLRNDMVSSIPDSQISSVPPDTRTPSFSGGTNTCRTIPKFQVKKPACSVKVQNTSNSTVANASKLIPCFKKKVLSIPSSSKEGHTAKPTTYPTESIEVNEQCTSVPSNSKVQTPSFSTAKPQTLSSKLSLKKASVSNKTVEKGKVTANVINNTQKVPSTPQHRSISTPGLAGFGRSDQGDLVSLSPCLSTVQHVKVTSASSSVTSTPLMQGVKRLAQQINAGEGTPKPKKPRAKPQIQENVDVEQLARAGQLNKVNSITLMAWLKARGVPCKCKDKKKEIEDKVRLSLNLHVPES
ncbi:hypothetical protein FSP39_011052 [Pinctada imbricata]|uniref:DUF4708 domain-containing protein n=1 Tax=Pinctada imbricata TaxID=66713 RepID=A0AA88XYZ1_PINIB|nr:hypothetical protein FSP39_011052 [Pinctada imbricata]